MDVRAIDLLPGERILWEGRPVRHRVLRPPDALLVPFSIMWCGFAVFWEATALTSTAADDSAPIFFARWGIPLVLIGLHLVVGRLIVRAIASCRTRYVITDRRVLVIGWLSGARTISTYLNSPTAPYRCRTTGPIGQSCLRRVPASLRRVQQAERLKGVGQRGNWYARAVGNPRGTPRPRSRRQLPGRPGLAIQGVRCSHDVKHAQVADESALAHSWSGTIVGVLAAGTHGSPRRAVGVALRDHCWRGPLRRLLELPQPIGR